MAMGPKGGRVGATVLFNKGLCTSAAHENSGVKRQRGCTSAVENGFVGSSMKATMESKSGRVG